MRHRGVVLLLSVSRLLLASGLFFRKHESIAQPIWSSTNSTALAAKTGATSPPSTMSYLLEENDDTPPTQQQHKGVNLDFEGKFRCSEALHPAENWERTRHFFQEPDNRNLLLKGGDNPLEAIPATAELYDVWETQSRIVKSQRPDRDEEIVAIYTTVPLFPGLHIDAVSYAGVKLIDHWPKLPMYEVTLIKEYYLPRGSKTMEWLFGRIAGSDSQKQQQYHMKDGKQFVSSPSRQTHAMTRVSLDADDSGESIQILYSGHVKVSCIVPRNVIRFLPFSKHALEAKVSKSIVKQLKREGVVSLQKYKKAWNDWQAELP